MTCFEEGGDSVMKAIGGTAEPISDADAVGFDAIHTLTATSILAGVARDEPFACALLRLNPKFSEMTPPRQEAEFAAEFAVAKAEMAAGAIDRAAERLMPFLVVEAASAAVLAALAGACLRANRVGDALALVGRCLDGSPLYPPALLVAGEAELARGNRKAAQGFLAKAARIARKMPEHIEAMRAAQQLLLRLQFG